MIKILAVFLLTVTIFGGCGNQDPSDGNSSCFDMVTDLYEIPNCAMWDISGDKPHRWSATETTIWCRNIVTTVMSYCSQCDDTLQKWLNCRPTKCEWNNEWGFPLADDCNDEMDKILNCVADQCS